MQQHIVLTHPRIPIEIEDSNRRFSTAIIASTGRLATTNLTLFTFRTGSHRATVKKAESRRRPAGRGPDAADADRRQRGADCRQLCADGGDPTCRR
jgi:hypothetical protein